jgi:transposase
MKLFRDPVSPPDQLFLLPPSVQEFVADDSAARLFAEVVDTLDCHELYARYSGGGAPAYDPRMMLKILLFGYNEGIRSSRKLDAACGHDLRFMFLAQMGRPDFRTIARFRQENEEAIKALFVEVARLCQAMGLVLLEHVAVDGTKIEADVSGNATYSSVRVQKELEQIEKRITRALEEAEAADQAEDDKHGNERGDGPAGRLKGLKERKKRLEEAKKALAESGRNVVAMTDEESRVMRTRGGNRPAYNAQAAVDDANQIIVAAEVIQEVTDTRQFGPMIEAVQRNTGATPVVVTADAGYASKETLASAEELEVDAYVAQRPDQSTRADYSYDAQSDTYLGCTEATKEHRLTLYRKRKKEGRSYHIYKDAVHKKELWIQQTPPKQAALEAKMHEKLRSREGRAVYRLRQQTVEPVFGHLKTSLLLRRFLLRGLSGVRTEFLLACSAHNIGKLRSVWRFA